MTAQRSHVALLRGVNVGGRNKLAMALLGEVVQSLGHAEVVTYAQSGNVAFAAQKRNTPDDAIAGDLAAAIAERTGVRAAVIVLGAAELATVVRDNPFPGVSDHRLLHAVFLREPPEAAGHESVAAAVARARAKRSADDARVVGRVLYLWTPEWFGRSVLRAELERGGANRTPMAEGTARNWATVVALTALVPG